MAKRLKIIILFLFLLTSVLVVGNFAVAQSTVDLWGGQESNISNTIGLGAQDPRLIIANVIRVALGFLGVIALGLIIYSGWTWMTAAGNPERIEKAKKILLGAVIGLIIVLSSFAIASFFVNKLYTATGGGGGAGFCTGGGCFGGENCINCPGDCGPCPSSTFQVNSKVPNVGTFAKNVRIKYYFNNWVNGGSVDASSFIVTGNISGPIGGTRPTSGAIVDFLPLSGTCGGGPNPCLADNCLPPNETITVTANNGILDVGGTALDCSAGVGCVATFITNDLIDCQLPTVNLLSDTQVCLDTDNRLGSDSIDDSGISQVVFTDTNSNQALPFDLPAIEVCPGPGICGQSPANWVLTQATAVPDRIWRPVTGDYAIGTDYTITATADDLVGQQALSSRTYNLKAAHCCDGLLNGLEDAIDCGGPDCAACAGGACAIDLNAAPACTPPTDANCVDSLCASNLCNCGNYDVATCFAAGYTSGGADCCICEDGPIIDWVTPIGGFCDNDPNVPCQDDGPCVTFCDLSRANGADDNLVTIGGRFFGIYVFGSSHVYFSDDGGLTWPTEAFLADTANSNCSNTWTNNQIIVVMPNLPVAIPPQAGIQIKVVSANTFEDTTVDIVPGEPILDFVYNTITRPGLCDLAPPNAQMDVTLTYQGVRLNAGTTAYFGNITSNVVALNSVFPSPLPGPPPPDTYGTADVPNLTTGLTSTFVIDSTSGINIASNYLDFTKDDEDAVGPFIASFSPTSGASGQYVTIYGNGFKDTQLTSRVWFGVSGSDEANYTFPAGCADSVWSDNQVIVKVPSTIGTPAVTVQISMDIDGWPTTITSSGSFVADDTLPLKPSLCNISPETGPNDFSPVSLLGEYFINGAGPTVSRFQLNEVQTEIVIPGPPDEIITTVPTDASSGDIRVAIDSGQNCANTAACEASALGPGWECIDDGTGFNNDVCQLVGNGMDFTVGNCTVDANCGAGGLCCPAGSYSQFRCATPTNPPAGIDIDDCYPVIGSSVFEWDFDTIPGLIPDTCAGYSLNQCTDSLFCPNSPGNCSPEAGYTESTRCDNDGDLVGEGIICANDGDCTGAATCEPSIGSCTDANCDTIGNCSLTPGSCLYDVNLNKCKDPTATAASSSPELIGLNSSSCDIASSSRDILNNPVNAYCTAYNNGTAINYRWHISTAATCPNSNWIRLPGNVCVYENGPNPECYQCNTGFDCTGSGATGECVVNQNICPGNSTCVGGVCEENISGECKCCCTIDNNDPGTGANPSCCAPLTCAGTCGADITDNNTGFGQCTGCRSDIDGDGSINATEQAASDAVCNCQGTSGKICDTTTGGDANGDGDPDGTCVDASPVVPGTPCDLIPLTAMCDPNPILCNNVGLWCDNLNTRCDTDGDSVGDGIICSVNADCDLLASETCENSCTCQAAVVGALCDLDTTTPLSCEPNDPFCSSMSLECDSTNTRCDTDGDSVGDGIICSVNADCDLLASETCENSCTCQAPIIIPPGTSCLDDTIPACVDACGVGLQCSSEAPLVVPSCGSCCCTVGAGDQCGLIDPDLTCNYTSSGTCADSTQGVAPDFGLCCGCSDDAQCGNPSIIGCGNTTCCNARPTVLLPPSPDNNDTGVCRNTQMSVTFNDIMDISSFSGNVVVVGHYGTSPCPDGTQYILAKKESKNIFVRTFNKIITRIKKILSPIFKKTNAFDTIFCAIGGTVSGTHDLVGPDTTTLTFTPRDLLEGGIQYYVIIKGDGNIGNNVDEGVLNINGISMIDNWRDFDGGGVTDFDRTFNGTRFYGYAYTFTTKSALTSNDGICTIDHIELTPDSYLFQTTTDDGTEVDDNVNDYSFDSVNDSDKVFTARAIADDGQVIVPITGVYEFDWEWVIADNNIVNYDTAPGPYPFLPIPPVTPPAPPTNQQNKQLIEANPLITDGNTTITVTARERSTGFPYSDQSDVFVFVCENPWPPVVGGNWLPWSDSISNCLAGTGTCYDTNQGLYYCRDAGDVGTSDDLPAILSGAGTSIIRGSSTIDNLLKEFYFLREVVPDISTGLSVSLSDQSTSTDGVVDVAWTPPAPLGSIDNYNIYYGTSPGSYIDYVQVPLTDPRLKRIHGLNTGQTYYISITGYSSVTGAESENSTEVSITLGDTQAPQVPTGLISFSSCDSEATLRWDANTDDTVGYKIYYSANPGPNYGGSVDAGNVTEVTLTGLSNSLFYFAVTSYDAAGNENDPLPDIPPLPAVPEISVNIMPNYCIVAHWPFEIVGFTTPDIISGYDANVRVGALPAPARNGVDFAMNFNGSGYLEYLPPDNLLNFSDGSADIPFTISAWIKRGSLSQGGIIVSKYNIWGSLRGGYFLSMQPSGEVELMLATDSGIGRRKFTSSPLITATTTWHHIVVTYDASPNFSAFKLYVDGVEITNLTDDYPPGDPSLFFENYTTMGRMSDFEIGAYTDSFNTKNYFDGDIDEVMIFRKALNDSAINQLYTSYP